MPARSGAKSALSLLLLVSFFFLLTAGRAQAAPRVAVTIAPLHSLVSAVMQDVAQPFLLLSGGQSPHAASLKPSAMKALTGADLIVWVGTDFEVSLQKAITQAGSERTLTLIDYPGMNLLPVRRSVSWSSGDGDETSHRHGEHDGPDMHIWLSPENALTIVSAVQQALLQIDPQNSEIYQRNARQVKERIIETRAMITTNLAPVRNLPYMVFHDAYQYFEVAFGLSPLGAVTLNPENRPGVKTLLAINREIVERGARCIFHEPQFEPRLVKRIAEQTGIATGQLDPLGSQLAPGPDLWFELMYAMQDSILKCAEDTRGRSM